MKWRACETIRSITKPVIWNSLSHSIFLIIAENAVLPPTILQNYALVFFPKDQSWRRNSWCNLKCNLYEFRIFLIRKCTWIFVAYIAEPGLSTSSDEKLACLRVRRVACEVPASSRMSVAAILDTWGPTVRSNVSATVIAIALVQTNWTYAWCVITTRWDLSAISASHCMLVIQQTTDNACPVWNIVTGIRESALTRAWPYP